MCSGTLLGVPCSPGRHEREPRGFRSAAGDHPSRGVGLLPGCGAPRHLCASRVGVASLPDGPLSGLPGFLRGQSPPGVAVRLGHPWDEGSLKASASPSASTPANLLFV